MSSLRLLIGLASLSWACGSTVSFVDGESAEGGSTSDGPTAGEGAGLPAGTGGSGTGSGAGGSTSSGPSTEVGGAAASPVFLECQLLCEQGCAYFGPDCVPDCVAGQLDASCEPPYLVWLQCLEGCGLPEDCFDPFQPFHDCINPLHCNDILEFQQDGDTCSSSISCDLGHVGSQSCAPNPMGEACDCFFDGAYKGSCGNPQYTQCSTLFPCCQPFWRP